MHKLTVTMEDIRAAFYARYNGLCLTRTCPIAQALRRQFNAPSVVVRPDYIAVLSEVGHPLGAQQFTVTPTMRRYIRRWDRLGRASVHTFILKSAV